MMSFLVRPLDPLVFGTGRPFTGIPGARLESADLPPPSTLAGMVRSVAGLDSRGRFDRSRIPELLDCTVRGPFLAVLDELGGRAELAFPAPADALRLESPATEGRSRHALVRTLPLGLTEGEAVSSADLAPVGMTTPSLEKPARTAPPYWRGGELLSWLSAPDERVIDGSWGVEAPPVEGRVHVAVGSSGTAEEGQLFSTGGRRFAAKVDGAPRPLGVYFETNAPFAAGPVVLGGEGRLSVSEASNNLLETAPPDEVLESARAGHVRAYFATPAHFGTGSRWSPEGAQVLAQCHGRALVLSGWEMAPPEADGGRNLYRVAADEVRRGGRPKASRRLVPAGAVYFLALNGDGDAREAFVRRLWARSVHGGQDGRDGFGIVLFGTWDGERRPLTPEQRSP